MPVANIINQKLTEAFTPSHLETVNESHRHAGPADAETHFKVTVVSQAFEPLRKLARHQAVYAVLADELAGPVHALALHTYTAAEWTARQQSSPASPDCQGSSK